jgi:homeobox protein cut-like
VNAFVSTAGNFIDSALDQLDDQLESAMGGMSEKVGEELKEYSLTAEAMETAKAASSAWSSLGFAALRDEWRDAATEISAKQKDAKSAGRDLAEAAKASRREGAGDAENKALLKAMGSEIKRLTERVNLAETAFFSMLNDLDEAPDPSEPLARTTKAAEYVTGAGALRNDLDATKAELAAVKAAALSGANSEAARELRELKETISAKVDAAVKERTADVDKKTAEMEIAHETMRAQRDSLERTLSELRSRHDATQSELFELREGKFVETTVRDTGERESLAAEAETARVREAEARSEAQRLTHEVARLRERLRDGAANGGLGLGLATDVASTSSSLTAAEMDMDVAALRERLRLRDQVVELLKRDLATRDEANEGELSRLEDIGEGLRRSIADGEARNAALARELETRPTDLTVASLEARVRTLQALVDSRDLGEEGVPGDADVDADVEGRGAHSGGGVPTTSSDADPLNAALRRNRRLADELAAAKRDAENAYAKLDASTNEATEAQKAVEERDATIKQMEQHLIAATASTSISSASSPGQTSTPGAAGLNADLLPVVIGQRDRYKRKVSELEHRVGALEVDLDGEKVRAKRVDADNVSLFEKVRYLQAYYAERAPKTPAPSLELGGSHLAGGVDVSRSERWRRAARYGCGFDVRGGRSNASGVDPEMLPGGDADGAVGRYDEHHRANHDPYARFQEREAQMSEQRLRLHDRVALRGARAVMRSRVTRTVVVVYLGLMHLYLLYNTAVGCPAPVKT